MMFSSAFFGVAEGGPRGDLLRGSRDGELEAAQERKIQYVISQARLKEGDRVLELGCGWGSFAIAVSVMFAQYAALSSHLFQI